MAICVVLRWWIGFCEFEIKRPCQSVTRGTKLLSLVHSNLDDLKYPMTKGGKRFYVIFADDHFIFTWLCLLRTKDEVLEIFIK